MCQNERLRYSCCGRTEEPEAATLRFCVLSYPINDDDWQTGPRRPCVRYLGPKRTQIVDAKFCCSENCCWKLLARYRQGVAEAERRLSEKGSSRWRILPSKAGKQLDLERKELERAEAEHEGCKHRKEEFYAPHVFTEEDLEARRYYEEPVAHAM